MASFPSGLASLSAPRAARLVAVAYIAEIRDARARLASGADEEALHDLRVGLRRLRSWLRTQRDALRGVRARRSSRELRDLMDASADSRDLEVFIAWLTAAMPDLQGAEQKATRWLVRVLERKKRAADREFARRLRRDLEDLLRRLERRSDRYWAELSLDGSERAATLAHVMAQQVREGAAQLRLLLLQALGATDDRSAHRARVEGKRLRYLLEPVAGDISGGNAIISGFKRLQDALGDFHDAHVWAAVLRQSLQDALEVHEEALKEALHAVRPDREGREGQRVRRVALPPPDGVRALAARIDARIDATYQALQQEWFGEKGDAFFIELDAVAAALDEVRMPDVEIERKYLLSALPEEMPKGAVIEIRQGYLPGTRIVERVREMREGETIKRRRTMKAGDGVSRIEIEEEIPESVFEELWPLTNGKRLTKRRHRVNEGPLTWEIDEFTDRDLVLAEVELSHANQDVEIPPWLQPVVVRDVTGDPEYLNANLAR